MSDAKPLDLGDRVALWAAEGEATNEYLQEMLKRYEATVQSLERALSVEGDAFTDLEMAACWLLDLKEGPRDEKYEREKPLAWAHLRETVRRSPPSPEALDLRHGGSARLLSEKEIRKREAETGRRL